MKVLDISKLDTKKKPIVTIDEKLNKFEGKLPDDGKVNQANEMLKNNNFFEKMKTKELIP